jgi:hypothetical protein
MSKQVHAVGAGQSDESREKTDENEAGHQQ